MAGQPKFKTHGAGLHLDAASKERATRTVEQGGGLMSPEFFNVFRPVPVPSAKAAPGLKGQWAVDTSFYYWHTGTTWKRALLSSWSPELFGSSSSSSSGGESFSSASSSSSSWSSQSWSSASSGGLSSVSSSSSSSSNSSSSSSTNSSSSSSHSMLSSGSSPSSPSSESSKGDDCEWLKREVGGGAGLWYDCAMSASGRVRMALDYGGYPWVSTDHGVGWRACFNADGSGADAGGGDMARNWWAAAITPGQLGDGVNPLMAACEDDGVVWLSRDAGFTWSAGAGLTPRAWRGVSICSLDEGLTWDSLTAVAADGTVADSVDGGVNWVEAAGPSESAYAFNRTGDVIMIGGCAFGDTPGELALSRDGGSTWTTLTGLGLRDWRSVAMSEDCSVIYACADKALCWVSMDCGATWGVMASLGAGDWTKVSCNKEGNAVILCELGGSVRVSHDYGHSWKTMPGVQSDIRERYSSMSEYSHTAADWFGVAISADGAFLTACQGGGDVWTYGCLNSESSTSAGDNCLWLPRLDAGLWRAVASSDNGDRCVATGLGTRVWLGRAAGANWRVWPAAVGGGAPAAREDSMSGESEDPNLDMSSSSHSSSSMSSIKARLIKGYTCAAMSADGMTILLGQDGGTLQQTTDFGVTWKPVGPKLRWKSCAVAGDGKHMLASVDGGRVWLSLDKGLTWSEQTKLSKGRWLCVALSKDGEVGFAANSVGCVYGFGLKEGFEGSSSSSSSSHSMSGFS